TKTNKIWLGAFSVLILILITTFIWLSFSKPSSGNDLSQVDFTVTADKKAGDYVQKESQFIIQPTAKVSKKDLEESLSIEPAIDFQIKKDSQGFIIKPQEELALNTIYNISIKQKASQPPLSFAFQTIGDFQVVSSLPCNEARWVPTNSGIEISFSHQLSDIDKFFQIEPQTAGTFQKNQKTITFIPQSDLKANIIYTVTIKAGLTANNGDKLKEDYIFKFRTDNGSKWSGENFFSPQTRLTESFLSDDKVILEFSASENFTGKEFITDIYKVKDSAEYLDLAAKTQKQIHPVLGEISDAKISPQGLPKLSSFASTLQRNGQYDWLPTFIMLPQNPGLGYYLLDTYNKENPQIRCQKLIQISDIALYTESSNGKTLFWANDTKSQQPLAKATIQITNGEQKINQNFQADGTVIIENKELEAGSLLIKNGKQEFADYLDFHKAQKASPSEDYYAYVYTDREAYQPTDNILFWGMIIPRKDAPMPKNIHLDWQDGGQNPNGLEIELKADGSFQGKLPLNKHSSQYMSLDFFLPQDKNNKDKVLASKGIQIMEYIKPAYTIEPQYDKDFFRHGEKISGTILGSFFDGTPAANLLLERYVNQKDDTAQKILLDAQGKNTFSFPVTEKHESWDPYQITMNLQTVSPEDESSYISTPILYFPSDYLLKAEDIGDNAAGLQLELKSYQIDFSKVNKDTQIYDSDFSDKIKGAPAEIKGKIAIYHNYYTKKQTGTYYDFIDKLNKPFYEYVHHEEIVKEIPFATQNGTYKTSLLPYKNTGVENYYAKVIYSNPDNTSFTQTIYPKSYFNAPNSYMITEYYFDFPQKGYNYQALENEKVNVQLMNNLGIAKEKGHLLYTIHQQGIMSQTIIDKNSFDLTFSKEYIPNINIYGAFFDGKHIYPVRNNTLGFKTDDQKLKIEIKKEDKLYAPGSDAELQFKVTDQAGKAVSASMVVSIVDEAAFAVQDQQISLLENLYQQVYFYPVATSASYIPHD
ncbi:MAG: Ig-like domain-containing protein, partial [Clostridiales bacterium]